MGRVLHASVRKHESGPKRPFLVVVEANLEDWFADALRADDIQLVTAEPIIVPETLAGCGSTQRRAEGLRFRLFGMTNYDKIVYIDADALVVGPLSHLFSAPAGVTLLATINSTRWIWRVHNVGDD